MKNLGLQQQILNMQIIINTFKMNCHYAALTDDGRVDPEEQKILKQIDKASEKFLNELKKIK